MIEYVANYTVGQRPYICKKFTASNDEDFHTALSYANETERNEMSNEVIYQHLRNLTRYIHDASENLSIVELDEDFHGEKWCIRGWFDLSWAATDADLWWGFAYYREEEQVQVSNPIVPNFVDESPAEPTEGTP